MKHDKTYFILPTTIYKPDDLIQLGQVITDPRKPFERLTKPLPFDGILKPRISQDYEWSATDTKTGGSSVDIFTHFVNMIRAGILSAQYQHEVQTWEKAFLETQFLEISEDPTYVERTAKVETVEEWLKEHRHLGKTLYMITGLKIVKNPGKIAYDDSDTLSLAANLKATIGPKGILQAGGEASKQRSNGVTFEAKPEASFLFAYRLRKLRVTWRNKFKLGDYKKGGDLYSVGDRGVKIQMNRDDEDEYSAFEIDSVAYEQEDFGQLLPAKDKKFEAVDEEDSCSCLIIQVAAKKIDG
ncbi:hypothetical protein F5B20DRAFT_133472 [Whalleya microplaca]|nr:hypothetical protein F5B20DRAFT_133472 [Whalleya microplaca]